jgi:predicted phosphohydrolase
VIDPESKTDTPDYRYRVQLPAISEAAHWHYLPTGPLHLAGGRYAVVGTIGWFTDEGYSEWFDADAGERDQQLARQFANELEESIRATEKSTSLIVVTHHVPHPACLPVGDPRQGEHSVHTAEVIARHADRIEFAVHGHKHRRYGPETIGGMRYIANPFGYPRQHEGPQDGLRVIELAV